MSVQGVSPLSTRTRTHLPTDASPLLMQPLQSVAGGSSHEATKALAKLLSLPSRTGGIVVSKEQMDEILGLSNAVGESASLAITFNGDANPKNLSFFPALTTVYKDPEVKCCGSAVYRDFTKTV